MIKADWYYIQNLRKILKEGSWDENPRPKWADGTPANSKFITGVFEEYDILTKKRGVFGASLEESTILRLILPHSLDNLTKQNESQAKRYIEHDQFLASSSLDLTDGGRAIDKRFASQRMQTGFTPMGVEQTPTHGDFSINADQSINPSKPMRSNDLKIFLNFKNTLPFKEEPQSTIQDFEA